MPATSATNRAAKPSRCSSKDRPSRPTHDTRSVTGSPSSTAGRRVASHTTVAAEGSAATGTAQRPARRPMPTSARPTTRWAARRAPITGRLPRARPRGAARRRPGGGGRVGRRRSRAPTGDRPARRQGLGRSVVGLLVGVRGWTGRAGHGAGGAGDGGRSQTTTSAGRPRWEPPVPGVVRGLRAVPAPGGEHVAGPPRLRSRPLLPRTGERRQEPSSTGGAWRRRG